MQEVRFQVRVLGQSDCLHYPTSFITEKLLIYSGSHNLFLYLLYSVIIYIDLFERLWKDRHTGANEQHYLAEPNIAQHPSTASILTHLLVVVSVLSQSFRRQGRYPSAERCCMIVPNTASRLDTAIGFPSNNIPMCFPHSAHTQFYRKRPTCELPHDVLCWRGENMRRVCVLLNEVMRMTIKM